MTWAGLRHLWQHRRLTLLAFIAASLLAMFFALRLVVAAVYWSDPVHLEQAPDGWMTTGYVARSWQVDPKDVAQALGLDPETHARGVTLEDIAEAQGRPLVDLIADLAAYLAETRP